MTFVSDWTWEGIGLFGGALFASRFVVQWYVAEKKKQAVIPDAFWWLSIAAGLVTFVYAVHKQSLAIGLQQALGLVIYVRNLMLVARRKANAASTPDPGAAAVPPPHARIDAGERAPAQPADRS